MTASLRELLDQGADDAADSMLVSGPGGALTWSQLRERARGIGSALVREGVSPQDRVVFVGKNDTRFFEVLFGCGLAAAVFVPLNWRLTSAELAAMISDCGAAVVVVDQVGADALESVLDDLPPVCTVVTLDGHPRWPDLDGWRGPAEDPGVPAEPGHVAFQLYTSGTTGGPKGALFANGTNLRVLLDDISGAWGLRAGNVSLLVMPLFHMGGLAWALAGMARRARGVVVADFVPDRVLDTMADERVTHAFFVPTMLAALCAVPAITTRPLALAQVIYSGSPISTTALTSALEALRCDFVQIYGMTEATGAFAQLSAADHRDAARSERLRSAGGPYPWVEIRVVDPRSGREVADGLVGEIHTRSEQNMLGYWNRPAETAAALVPGGWLRTGDLGYLDEGRIYLVDRAKDLVITGGENVYPAEIEDVLAAHPDLAEVAVIGVPDRRWGETVKAVVVARPGTDPDPAGVITFARERLAHFKCPTSVDFVDALPRTATGKVVKPRLRERYWQGRERGIN
jgi:long-chain acyl-CoA synthetase